MVHLPGMYLQVSQIAFTVDHLKYKKLNSFIGTGPLSGTMKALSTLYLKAALEILRHDQEPDYKAVLHKGASLTG